MELEEQLVLYQNLSYNVNTLLPLSHILFLSNQKFLLHIIHLFLLFSLNLWLTFFHSRLIPIFHNRNTFTTMNMIWSNWVAVKVFYRFNSVSFATDINFITFHNFLNSCPDIRQSNIYTSFPYTCISCFLGSF